MLEFIVGIVGFLVLAGVSWAVDRVKKSSDDWYGLSDDEDLQ